MNLDFVYNMPVIPLDQLFVETMAWVYARTPASLHGTVAILLRIVVIGVLVYTIAVFLFRLERKIIMRIQNWIKHNHVGGSRFVRPLADGIRLQLDSSIIPLESDQKPHALAPMVTIVPAVLLFAVIPFGRNMVPADLSVGVLYILTISTLIAFAVLIDGWVSRSNVPLMVQMRTMARIITFAIPQIFSLVAVVMVVGSMSLVAVVEAQFWVWFITKPWGLVACLIFFLSGIAGCERTLFVGSEEPSRIVDATATEHGGVKFDHWQMVGFVNAFALCALVTTLFFGGWRGPAVPFWVMGVILLVLLVSAKLPLAVRIAGMSVLSALILLGWGQAVPSWLWFLAKICLLMIVRIWIRGAFLRFGTDRLMGLTWKFLLPLAFINIIATGFWVHYPSVFGEIISLVLLVFGFWILVRVNHSVLLKSHTY